MQNTHSSNSEAAFPLLSPFRPLLLSLPNHGSELGLGAGGEPESSSILLQYFYFFTNFMCGIFNRIDGYKITVLSAEETPELATIDRGHMAIGHRR